MWLLPILLHISIALAEGPESEAVLNSNSILREAQNQDSCNRIEAFEKVCGTLGLNPDQRAQAKNLVERAPNSTLIANCATTRERLKICLEAKKEAGK